MRFEKYVSEQLDPQYGRYIAWVLFSVGAENLAKAACVCSGCVPVSSDGHYGELGKYMRRVNGEPKGHLVRLALARYLTDSDRKALTDGYLKLIDIRNRDAHTYVPTVRHLNFPDVEKHFVPAFNILVRTMQCNGHF